MEGEEMVSRCKVRLFITGIYRSGTILVTRILNNHPRLWVTYDSIHFMRFSYGRYDPIWKSVNIMRLVRDTHKRISSRYGMELDEERVISRLRSSKRIGYRHVYDALMADLCTRYKPGAIGWAEKTNVCWEQIPNFLSMFPDGKVIHTVRDPRDVMCSYREMTYEPGYSYLDSAFCSLSSFSKASEYRRVFSPRNYYVLRYEQLLREPRREIKRVCDFLEIPFGAAMLDVKSFKDNRGEQWSGGSSFDRKMGSISTKPIARWKKKAAPLEVFLVELINRDVMKHYGYELSGLSITRKDWMRLYDILRRSRLLRGRFEHWLKTGEGVEGYPSDPLVK